MKSYKRTILITGATDGIGRQLAFELASHNDENFVIIHGRCRRKCEETVEALRAENRASSTAGATPALATRLVDVHAAHSPQRRVDFHISPSTTELTDKNNVDYVIADFSQASQVCRMADEVKSRFPRLNALIGCASVLVPRKMVSHDGNELTLQVNHLSHYILWNMLLPLLERNAPSRIVTVGSMLHSFSSIDWEDVNCERGVYDKFLQYSRTKLMNHLATFYIHRLLFARDKRFQVTANVVDADQQTDRRLSRTYANNFNALSASESHLNAHANGVNTLVRLIESDKFIGISGKYFDANGKEMRKSAEAGDVRLQDRAWAVSGSLAARVAGATFVPLSAPPPSAPATPARATPTPLLSAARRALRCYDDDNKEVHHAKQPTVLTQTLHSSNVSSGSNGNAEDSTSRGKERYRTRDASAPTSRFPNHYTTNYATVSTATVSPPSSNHIVNCATVSSIITTVSPLSSTNHAPAITIVSSAVASHHNGNVVQYR